MQQRWKTVIKPKYGLFEFDFKDLWNYRDLCFMFVKKNYITKYKQTILGPFYLVLSPLITSGLFSVVFGMIAGIETDGVPNFLFYMISNIFWSFFAANVMVNKDIFIGNAYLMGKVYFPRLVVPISNLITNTINLLVQIVFFSIIALGFSIYGVEIIPNYLLLLFPIILLEIGLLGMGLGLIVSSLSINYRDINVAIGMGINLLMYATPVIYPLSSVSENIRNVMYFNPLSAPMEILRYGIFGVGTVEKGSFGYSLIVALIVFMVGTVLFNRVEKTFIDTI